MKHQYWYHWGATGGLSARAGTGSKLPIGTPLQNDTGTEAHGTGGQAANATPAGTGGYVRSASTCLPATASRESMAPGMVTRDCAI